MGMYASLGISASGLAAERLRMDVVASNLANADSTTGVGEAFRRRLVELTPATSGPSGLPGAAGTPLGAADGAVAGGLAGVRVSGIVEDEAPMRRVYEPGHPLADGEGYVTKPNINAVTEMVDMVAATRAYQANVTAFEASKSMAMDALRLIR